MCIKFVLPKLYENTVQLANKCTYKFMDSEDLDESRQRVIPLSLSPSCVTRKKTVKKMAA